MPKILSKSLKLMLNLKRHNYDSLIVGLEATPLKKSIPLSEKITTVKEKPLGECYLSLVRGGAILTSLHLDKTTNPPSLQSEKTKFSLWFFFYCCNFSRLRELLFLSEAKSYIISLFFWAECFVCNLKFEFQNFCWKYFLNLNLIILGLIIKS